MPSQVEAPRMSPETTNTPLPVDKNSIGDLSRDLNSGRRIKKLGGIGAFVAIGALIGSSAVNAQDSETSQTAALLPSDETPRFEPFNADVNGDGKVTLGEVIVTFPDRMLRVAQGLTSVLDQAQTEETVTETQAEMTDEATQEFIPSFKEPTLRLQRQIFNQDDESIRDITFRQLRQGINKLYENHGDEIGCLEIPGWPFLTKEDMKWVLPQMQNGTPFSRKKEKDGQLLTEKERRESIDSSRLVTASEVITDFLLIHDNTTDPKLRESIADATDLTIDYIISSVDTHGSTENKAKRINGAVNYWTRNYRYKIAHPPVEHC